MHRRVFMVGLVLATLLLAGLGACISFVRSVRAILASSLAFERSTVL